MHKLREISKMQKIQEWNTHYKEKDDYEEDGLRKLSQVGTDIDRSVYNEHKANKIKKDGPFGAIYRKKQDEKNSEKMVY